MAKKVPYEVIKESYLLKSTFFYGKLRERGYFDLFLKIQKFIKVEGKKLNWDHRGDWNISESSWEKLIDNKIDPAMVFIHPKVLKLYPQYLKYYRSVSMLPQKGLKALANVSNVDRIEEGKIEPQRISDEAANSIACVLNEVLSLVVDLSKDIDKNQIQGMMYATAGTNIDGSWRNSIGEEGERVIRTIIVNELSNNNEISSVVTKNNDLIGIEEIDEDEIKVCVDYVKNVNLTNGYSMLFSSEPDIAMYDDEGKIVGVIEIKAGLDPAGALERLGAMLKSFENTLDEYPNAVTVLVASCITDEVEERLGASMLVRQKHLTTDITSSEASRRKFANRMRKILKLI